jgi:hypothetical protein
MFQVGLLDVELSFDSQTHGQKLTRISNYMTDLQLVVSITSRARAAHEIMFDLNINTIGLIEFPNQITALPVPSSKVIGSNKAPSPNRPNQPTLAQPLLIPHNTVWSNAITFPVSVIFLPTPPGTPKLTGPVVVSCDNACFRQVGLTSFATPPPPHSGNTCRATVF